MLRIHLICLSLALCVIVSGFAGPPVQATSPGPQTPSVARGNSVAGSPIEDKWALVIGISKFEDPSIDLKYAAKDAGDFRDFLISEEHFAPDHVKILLNEDATRERILSVLGDKFLPRVAGPNDLVVIYISTHGSPSMADIKGLNYLVAHNTSKDDLYATGIPMEDLTRIIRERVHAERVVLILDACHSGVADPDRKGLYRQANFDAGKIADETRQLVICSSEPQQVSWESKAYPNSIFTHHLIEALRQNGAGTTIASAYEHLRKQVQQEVLNERGELQTPVMKANWEGDKLALAAIPSAPRPAPEEVPTPRPQKEQPVDRPVTATARKVASTGSYDLRKGIAGSWESNWGATTFFHDPITGDKPVAVTGFWLQSSKHRGIIQKGTYNPGTRTFEGSYYQGWNFVHGKARLTLSEDARTMQGSQKHFGFAWSFPWLLWRPGEAAPQQPQE